MLLGKEVRPTSVKHCALCPYLDGATAATRGAGTSGAIGTAGTSWAIGTTETQLREAHYV